METYTFKVVQNGVEIASVWSTIREIALRDAMHYAVAYCAGPIEIRGPNSTMKFDRSGSEVQAEVVLANWKHRFDAR